jgi:cobalt-zinc-cadmium efflux system outer membrane protein
MPTFFARAPLRAAAIMAASASATALAQPAPAAEPITLAAAVERTLAANPDLASYVFRLRAQSARVEEAALRAPFELDTEVQDVLGTGRTSGFDAAEATFAISHVLELGGKRERRVDAARAEVDVVEAERAAATLDAVAEVARRYIHVAADQAHLALTVRASALAGETVQAAEMRVAAARAPEVELRRARVALARAGIEQEHAEHELLASRRKLVAMWGDSEAVFGEVGAALFELPEAQPFEALLRRLEGNPDYLAFASEARLRDAEIRLAETRARSDVTLTAGIRRLQQGTDTALTFGVQMPLFSAARAESAIAAARAERSRTDAEREAHRVRTEAQLFELYQELQHSLTEADVLDEQVLPEMEAALAATREAFDRGRYSYLEWMDAQRELLDVQRARIEAAANAHLYRVEIERLTGEPLPVAPIATP